MTNIKEKIAFYSLSSRNKRGSKKFAKLNPKSEFAKLTKKVFCKRDNTKYLEEYNENLKLICNNIVNRLKDENDVINTKYGIKLTTDNINSIEILHEFYNVLYCDGALKVKDYNFRDTCGPMLMSYFDNINFEGEYNFTGYEVEKDNIVVDIGASYGLYALLSLKIGAKKVYCYESDDKKREILLKNREINGYTENEMVILGKIDNLNNITEKIDVLKINIDGKEYELISTGDNLFKNNPPLKIVTTIYGTANEHSKIREKLESFNKNYSYRVRVAKMHMELDDI